MHVTGFDECQVARSQEQYRTKDIGSPDEQVLLKPAQIWEHCVERIDVEQDGSHKLQRAAQLADVAGTPAEPHNAPRRSSAARWELTRIRRLKQLQVCSEGEGNRTGKEDPVDRDRINGPRFGKRRCQAQYAPQQEE